MKRAEFINWWIAKRRAFCDREVSAFRMRESERAMTLANSRKEAINSWNKDRATLREIPIEDFTQVGRES